MSAENKETTSPHYFTSVPPPPSLPILWSILEQHSNINYDFQAILAWDPQVKYITNFDVCCILKGADGAMLMGLKHILNHGDLKEWYTIRVISWSTLELIPVHDNTYLHWSSPPLLMDAVSKQTVIQISKTWWSLRILLALSGWALPPIFPFFVSLSHSKHIFLPVSSKWWAEFDSAIQSHSQMLVSA